MKTEAFSICGQAWKIRLSNGEVHNAQWNSKGAALAAIKVEEARLARKQLQQKAENSSKLYGKFKLL